MYGIFSSPCNGCYKRSIQRKGLVAMRGYYCKDLIWDSRGRWGASSGFEDKGVTKRGKCPNRFEVAEV